MKLLTPEEQSTAEQKALQKIKNYCVAYSIGKPNGEEIGRHIRHELCQTQLDADLKAIQMERQRIVSVLRDFVNEEQCDENCELSENCAVVSPLIPHKCIAYESLLTRILEGI